MKWSSLLFVIALVATVSGCKGKLGGGAPLSAMPNQNNPLTAPPVGTLITQTQTANTQLDILFEIDTSGNMLSLQTNLASSLGNTINYFSSQKWDFHLSVAGTDAYMADPTLANYNPSNAGLALFRDGGATHTGVFIVTPQTPNFLGTIFYNLQPGEQGNNDERAFSSFRTALSSSANGGFLRPNSFLAIVNLTDEDDFSGNGRGADVIPQHSYSDPNLDSINTYVSNLDTLTGTTGNKRRYNVSSINIQDSACQTSRVATNPYAIIGLRLQQIAQATGGVLGNICNANYVTDMTNISASWGTLATQVYITFPPNPTTFTVAVNGSNIAQDSANGWTYNSASQSIQFHGASLPVYGANITVTYTQ